MGNAIPRLGRVSADVRDFVVSPEKNPGPTSDSLQDPFAMLETYFLADLHLFTRRSLAPRHEAAIRAAAARASTFVFGGDIFDFAWCEQPTVASAVDQAARWLERLVAEHGQCQFYFLLGNHDCHPHFVKRLDELARSLSNLQWAPYYLRLGDNLFLHGDVRRRRSVASLVNSRRRWMRTRPRGSALNRLYDLAMQSGLHKVATRVAHPKRTSARRILRYLEEIGHGPDDGVRHVYFGHTHRQMSGFEYGGLTFHNSGSPMRGVPFRIVKVCA